MLGVSDIDKARALYSGILGYDNVVYDQTGIFNDLAALPGGQIACRRVLLRHSQPRQGSFSRLLGPSEIELIQVRDRTASKIYQNRYWGDLGFIHLCYDIVGMQALEQECRAKGFPFTINSSTSFEMGEAAGHFAYIEDPDGTLIEFVETHRIPILKKIGWYLNLKNRSPKKALPDWMLKTLSFSQVKD
ncbi:MAG: VOC family protein [Adhaeribacter sp.]